jgi:hypothetical protein
MTGVWDGTYTVLKPDGSVVERFASRQEGLMSGTDWTETVVYLRDGVDPVVQHFHATVRDDDVDFDTENMWGSTSRAGEQAIVFTFGWHDRPQERIVEMSLPDGDYRTRLWQHFEGGSLSRLTLIEERRRPGGVPDPWYQRDDGDPSTDASAG